ncbi:hypothetical protein DV735_g5523, partial [Chaetothyriales sp. CBS 134920]
MLRGSSDGLTVDDFHPQGFINPRDVFPGRSRQPNRIVGANKAASSGNQATSLPAGKQTHKCCGRKDRQGCVNLEEDGSGALESCEGDCAQCEDCLKDHHDCEDGLIKCVDNCEDCIDEHDAACGQHGQVCTEECNDCDFSCFDCIDWNVFERDKSLGLSYTVPILEQPMPSASPLPDFPPSCDFMDMDLNSPMSTESPIPPVDMSMHHYCLNSSQVPLWNAFAPTTYCSPGDVTFNPEQNDHAHLSFQGPWGCHPAAAHRPPQNVPAAVGSIEQQPLPPVPSLVPVSESSLVGPQPPVTVPRSNTTGSDRICEWVMPCGTVCGASFATTADLKKHLKSIHTVKGTTSCRWQGCSATFASDAALTGHISKKHLSAAIADEDGPFKCTFAGCPKSFMYKQVRDEHVASSHNGSKMFCEICKQWLNAEGSNFKRHMASHQPKHEHMICKFHHLGCKRRFPRLDNLRRHEGCCKFGKKAAMHHHHHHRHISNR